MFRRYKLTPIRIIFWLAAISAVCLLLAAARDQTRRDVYLGYEVFNELSARKKPAEILAELPELRARADAEAAAAAPEPPIFMTIPFLLALVMFFVPFIVRRDHRRPVRGILLLPFMTLLCYLFAALTNMVVSAGAQLAIHSYLGTKPGPDFFVTLVSPLYLFWPTGMGSAYGTASQVVYLIYICSVLTTKGRRHSEQRSDDRESVEISADAQRPSSSPSDSNGAGESSCIMELDRLCRIIGSKFGDPNMTQEIKNDVMDHINTPFKIEEEMKSGLVPFRIVLLEAAKCIRRLIDEDPSKRGAQDAFLYVVDEMERMGYCSQKDCLTLRNWVNMKQTER